MWLCKDTKNQNIYGYVTADYYVKDNRVSNFSFNTTSFYSEIMNNQFPPNNLSTEETVSPLPTVVAGTVSLTLELSPGVN